MGFRELGKFNETMLAKTSVEVNFCFTGFKAKYFPIGSIFDAKTKSGSYAWKGILQARK